MTIAAQIAGVGWKKKYNIVKFLYYTSSVMVLHAADWDKLEVYTIKPKVTTKVTKQKFKASNLTKQIQRNHKKYLINHRKAVNFEKERTKGKMAQIAK